VNCPCCLSPLPEKPFNGAAVASGKNALGMTRNDGGVTRRFFCDPECCQLFAEQHREPPYYAKTYEEIAVALGVSKQRVQQLERSGLKKLARLQRQGLFL
jgi:transcriptional regulator with XRE-family HTH domain